MVPPFSIIGYRVRSPDLRHSELCSIHVSSFFHDFMFSSLPVKTLYSYPCIQHARLLSPLNSPLTSDPPRTFSSTFPVFRHSCKLVCMTLKKKEIKKDNKN